MEKSNNHECPSPVLTELVLTDNSEDDSNEHHLTIEQSKGTVKVRDSGGCNGVHD